MLRLQFFSILTLVLAVQASWLGANVFGRDKIFGRDIVRKQANSSGQSAQASNTPAVTPSPSASSTPADTTSAPPSSTPTSTTPAPSSTPTSTTPAPSSTPTSTPASSTPTTSSKQSTTTKESSKDTTTQTKSTTTATPTVDVITTVVTVSNSVITSVFSSTQTSASSSSSTPAELNSDGTAKSSGMSTKTKNTVIGVVVGIGGAIVLGGLFIVAWRIWGRKKNEDESDGLMGYRGNSPNTEMNSVAPSGAPNQFQSTLENYHNPARNANVSSNF